MNVSNSSRSSSQFSTLCSLASFVANDSENMFAFSRKFTPNQVSVLASLIASGAEIEYLALHCELPAGTGIELGSAIKRSKKLRELYLHMWGMWSVPVLELPQLVAVASSPALKRLKINRLAIDSDCMVQICDSLAASPRFRSLTITNCDFSAPPLASRIGSLRALETFHVADGKFSPSDIEMILAGMRDLPAVADLVLDGVEIGTSGCRELGGGLLGRISRKLTLTRAKLGNEGVSAIADAVISSGRKILDLQELCLSANCIGPTGVRKLVGLVASSPRLRCLDLGWNPAIAGGAADIVGSCANTLQELNISGCMLGQGDLESLFARGCHHALTVFKMASNEAAGDLGAGVVARFMLHHGGRTLRDLCMSVNSIEDVGALELARGLGKAYALRSIDLQANWIGPCGASAILNALATASTAPMDMINFGGCNIGDKGASAVGSLIAHRGCRSVLLERTEIHCKGAKALADSVGASERLTETLNLSANQIDDAGLVYLLRKITQRNRFVRYLSVCLSGIGEEGAMAVEQAAEAHGASLYYISSAAVAWWQFRGSFLGKLHKLDLGVNKLSNLGISGIVDAILASCGQRGCKLQELCLNSDLITSAGVPEVSELVACSPHLRCLDLSRNLITDRIAPQALKNCANSLHELYAEECELGPHGIAALLASDFRALTTLNISSNGMGDLGATAVAQFLLHHGGHTLKAFCMHYNEIEEAGALELAKGFAKAYALKSIDVRGNKFGPRGTAAVLDALATASTASMDKIDFSYCKIGDHGAEEVGRLIRCRGCECVILGDVEIITRGAKVIADSIGSSTVVTSRLSLLENMLGDEAITYLMDQIARKNDSICDLRINLQDVGVEGAMAIERVMEVHGALSHIMYRGLVGDMDAWFILDKAAKVSRGKGYAKLVNFGEHDYNFYIEYMFAIECYPH